MLNRTGVMFTPLNIFEKRGSDTKDVQIRELLAGVGAKELIIWPRRIALLYCYRTNWLVEGLAYWPREDRQYASNLVVSSFETTNNQPGLFIVPVDGDWCVFKYKPD